MEYRLLGPLEVRDGVRVLLLGAAKQRALLALLLLSANRVVPRERLIDGLWGDEPPETAVKTVQVYVSQLRKVLGPEALVTRPPGYLVAADPESIDLPRFERLRVEGRRALAGGDPGRAALLLNDALGLWRGPALAEFDEPFARVEGVRLEDLRLATIEDRIDADLALHRDADLVGELRALIGEHPHRERLREQLMLALYRSGRQVESLEVYRDARAVLDELGVEPGDALQRLERAVLTHDPGLRPAPELTSESGSGSGDRLSLKDRHNLPVRLTSFVGREAEMAEVAGLLASTRLLSLTGAGGSGKTRLAVETTSALIDQCPDGVWLVELAPLSDPTLVVQEIAETFEVREQPGTPLLESVVGHLSSRRLLLVLDNCEHLIDASAETAERLLLSCPDLRILVTSREPLHVPGEVVFRVPPLSLPGPEHAADPSSLAAFASIQLFDERARAVSPSFLVTAENAEDVAALCAHLDGLPLAIELAASRVALFPVSTIVERLDDRFRLLVGGSRTALSRQQTLQAMLEWSYDLLDAEEQALLRALSVFVGGIALDAAEEICAGEGRDVLTALGQLVEKSLVILTESDGAARYRLLETVREYGLQRIDEAGERAQVEGRHAEWFLQLAEQLDEALPWPDRTAALARLELEHDNIRAALDRSLAADPPRALRIAGAMWGFWLWRGYLTEGLRWLDLALSRVPGRTAQHAKALLGANALTARAGRWREGTPLGEQSLAIYRELGDIRSSCRVLHSLTGPAWGRDDLTGAERLYRESLATATETGFDPGRAAAMQGLGIVRWLWGDRSEAESLLEEALTLFRSITDADLAPPAIEIGEFLVRQPETGGVRLVFEETIFLFLDLPSDTFAGVVLANLGMIARAEGDYLRARTYVEEALVVFETVGDERFIGQTFARLAGIAVAEGEIQRARELLERSLEVRRASRDWRGITLTEASLGNLAIAEGDFEQARMLLQQSAETFLRRGDRFGYAATEGHLATLALARGDRAEYRRLLESNLAHVREIGRPRWIGWTLTQLAALARLDGDEERALVLVDEALAIFRRIEEPRGIEHCTAFRAARPERVVATFVFADMVESTRTASELGDQQWRSRIEAFLQQVRERVAAFGGREIDCAGDGMFCLFESPTRAIPCAQSITAAVRKLGAEVRIGIHTGECEVVGEVVRGVAVHIGARVGALARPGDVLVTRTVRDLVLGSEIAFENRGIHSLKGIDGEWELFAVQERAAVASP